MKSNTSKWLIWILYNGAIVGCTYLGLIRDIPGAANVLQLLVWTAGVVSLMASILPRDAVKVSVDPVAPEALDFSVDFAVVIALAWHAWWWSAVVFLLHVFFWAGVRSDLAKERARQAQNTETAR